MTNRIEILRKHIDNTLLKMTDDQERRSAYLHLYGVAQACSLIALKRKENAELAIMAGMLHDFYTYKYMDSKNHAENGALLARDVLNDLALTNPEETNLKCLAIHNHSAKGMQHSSFCEVLIDADVMQHCLYNITFPIKEHEKARFYKLVEEFGIEVYNIHDE